MKDATRIAELLSDYNPDNDPVVTLALGPFYHTVPDAVIVVEVASALCAALPGLQARRDCFRAYCGSLNL